MPQAPVDAVVVERLRCAEQCPLQMLAIGDFPGLDFTVLVVSPCRGVRIIYELEESIDHIRPPRGSESILVGDASLQGVNGEEVGEPLSPFSALTYRQGLLGIGRQALELMPTKLPHGHAPR